MNKIVNGVANDYEFEPPISAYGSVDLNELTKTIERLKKVPSFDVLLKENNKLQQELDQYKNNWEELKKWLEQEWLEWKDCEDARTKNFATEDKIILNKMKELEEE